MSTKRKPCGHHIFQRFRYQKWIGLILFTLLFSCAAEPDDKAVFSLHEINESTYRKAFSSNHNARLQTTIKDSLKIEKALKAIDKTYSDEEKTLAEHELCESPRCLTSYQGFYPELNLHLFLIQNYHYEKASFVFDETLELASGYRKFRGSYGVMSKTGLWAGLERDGNDSYLKLEVCESSKYGVWSKYKFDFAGVDINLDYASEELPVIFWADKDLLMISCHEYGQEQVVLKYYALKMKF